MSMASMGWRLDFRIVIAVALLFSTKCESRTVEITLDTDNALQKLSPYFLSITLDPIILIDQATGGRLIKEGFDTVRAMNMARGLSPAFLRLGGPSTDEGSIRFQAYTNDEAKHGDSLLGGFQGDNNSPKPSMTVNGAQLTLLNHFAEDSGLKLIVSLGYDHNKQQNKARKRAKGLMDFNDDESDMDSWDTKQALDIIRFANSNNLDLGYQLGYEAYYLNGSKIPLSKDNKLSYNVGDFDEDGSVSDADIVKREAENAGLGLGMDLVRLRSLIDAYPYSRGAQLFSPGICLPSAVLRHEEHSSDPTPQEGQHLQSFLQAFIGRADDALTAVVLHPYEYDVDSGRKEKGKTNKPNAMSLGTDGLIKVLGHSVGSKPICIGEKWKNKVECNESPEGSSDFDEALKWAQHLGTSARMGANVILHSPKTDALQNPDPQYWVSLLHKKLAGDTVLETSPSQYSGVESKFYAQCTPRFESYPMIIDSFPHGSVTLYAVNPSNESTNAVFRGFSEHESLFPDYGDMEPVVFEYILTEYIPNTSSGNKSRGTLLNGRLLKMDKNGDLPYLAPNEIPINLGEAKKCRIGGKGKGNTSKNKISSDESRLKRKKADNINKESSVGDKMNIPLHLPAKSVAFWVLPPSTGVKPCLKRAPQFEWKDFTPEARKNKVKSIEPQNMKETKGNYSKNKGKSGVVVIKDIKNPVEAHQCSIMHRRRRDLPQLSIPRPHLDIPTPAARIPRPPLLHRLRSLLEKRAKLGLSNAELDLLKLKTRLRNQRTKTPYLPRIVSFGVEEDTEEPSTGNAYETGVANLSEEIPSHSNEDEYHEADTDDYEGDDFGKAGRDVILPEEVVEYAAVSSKVRRESVEADKSQSSSALSSSDEQANDTGLYLENIDQYNLPVASEKTESDLQGKNRELFEAELPGTGVNMEEVGEAISVNVQPEKDNSLPKLSGESDWNFDAEGDDFTRDSVIVIEEATNAENAGTEVEDRGAESAVREKVTDPGQKPAVDAPGKSDTGYGGLYTMNDPIGNIEGQNEEKLFEEINYDLGEEEKTLTRLPTEGNIEDQTYNKPLEEVYSDVTEEESCSPGKEGNKESHNGDQTWEDVNYDLKTEEETLYNPSSEGEAKGGEMQGGTRQENEQEEKQFADENGVDVKMDVINSGREEPMPENNNLGGEEVVNEPNHSVLDKIAEFFVGNSPSESSPIDTAKNENVNEAGTAKSKEGTEFMKAESQSKGETVDDRTYEEIFSQIPAGNFDSELSWVTTKRDVSTKFARRRRREVNMKDSPPNTAFSSAMKEKVGQSIQTGEPFGKGKDSEQNPSVAEKEPVNQNVGGLNGNEKNTEGAEVKANPSIKLSPPDASQKSPSPEETSTKTDISDSSTSATKPSQSKPEKSDSQLKTSQPSSGSPVSLKISPENAMAEDDISVFKSIKDVVHGHEDEKLFRLSRGSAEDIRTPAEIARRLHLPDRVVFNLDPISQQLQSTKDNETLSTTTVEITTTTTAAPVLPHDGTKERAHAPAEVESHPIKPLNPATPSVPPTLPQIPTPPAVSELPKLRSRPQRGNTSFMRSRPTLPTLPSITMPTLPTIAPRPRKADAPTRPQPDKIPVLRSRPTLPTLPPITRPTRPTAAPRPEVLDAHKVPPPENSAILRSVPTLPTLPPIVRNFTRPTLPTRAPRPRMSDTPTRPPTSGLAILKSRPTLPTLPPVTRPTLPTPAPKARASDTRRIPAPGGLAILKSRPSPPTLPPMKMPTLPTLAPRARTSETRTRPTLLPVAPMRTRPARPSLLARANMDPKSPGTTTNAPTTTTTTTTTATTTSSRPETFPQHRVHRTPSDTELAGSRTSSLELAARERHLQLRRQMEAERRKLILDAAADSKMRTLEALTKRLTRDVGAQNDHGVAGRAADVMRQLSDNLATPLMKFWEEMKSRITHLRAELQQERNLRRRRRSIASGAQKELLEDEKRKILAEMTKSTLKRKEEELGKTTGVLNVKDRLRRDILGLKDGDHTRPQYQGVASKFEDLLRRRRQLVQSPGLFQMHHFRPKRNLDWGNSDDKEWPVDHEFMYYPSDSSDGYTEIRMGNEKMDGDSLSDSWESDLGSDVDGSYFAVDTARRGLYPIGPYGVLNHLYAQGELYKMADVLNDPEDHETPWNSSGNSETDQERSNLEDEKSEKHEEDANQSGDNKDGKSSSESIGDSKVSKEESKEHAKTTPETKKNLRKRRWTVNLKESDNGNELGWGIGEKPVSYDIDLIQKEAGLVTNKVMRLGAERREDGSNFYVLALKNGKVERGESHDDSGLTTEHASVETSTVASSTKRKVRDGESRVQKIPMKAKNAKEEVEAKTEMAIKSSTPVVSAAAAMGVANSFMSQLMNNMTELVNFFRSMIGWSGET